MTVAMLRPSLRAAPAAALWLAATLTAAAFAGDLSRYRDFQFGAGVETISRQTGVNPLQAKTLHRRPALLQELTWWPRSPGPSTVPESVKEVVFRFYNGGLFRIEVGYDRDRTEGLTAQDLVDAISERFGPPLQPEPAIAAVPDAFGDRDELVARWETPAECFQLTRTAYGPTFRLVGILKGVDTQAQAAMLEAARLDDRDAPRVAAELQAREEEARRAHLQKARQANKPKFRP